MSRRLYFLLIPVLIATCSPPPKGNPCADSARRFSSNRPIVCVNDSNLANITSDPYEAHGKRQCPIKWYTVSGQGGLSITFENDACVRRGTVDCSAGSHCDAQILADAATGTRCKYSVALARGDGKGSQDPVVIIDDGSYDQKE